jgi:lambda repressor-like predicted transcriptional regulator
MSFLKHIGKHGDRKVAILFREVPDESHMCLVTYTETLNRHIHDPMMECVESAVGQQSTNLADALNRSYTKDGKIILQVLHSQGLIKKVQTEQVLVTPNTNTKIKLSELNEILNEMEKGEEAVKRLAELDASRGLQTPADVARRMRENNERLEEAKTKKKNTAPTAQQGALSDDALVNNLRSQAQRMENEANGLLAEAKRLMREADEMSGLPLTTQTTEQPAKSNRGRKAKVTT